MAPDNDGIMSQEEYLQWCAQNGIRPNNPMNDEPAPGMKPNGEINFVDEDEPPTDPNEDSV
jgi:hypothetical protein